jgi:hypothetical protein
MVVNLRPFSKFVATFIGGSSRGGKANDLSVTLAPLCLTNVPAITKRLSTRGH